MVLLKSVLGLVLTASLVLSSPLGQPQANDVNVRHQEKRGTCNSSNKLQRKAWQALTDIEKKAYIDAERCLMSKPSKTNLPGAVTRFDDLIKAHQLQGNFVHFNGWFLPFHRLMVYAHEKLLREECWYKGAQPYWEEAIDVGRVAQSQILDPVLGFGGDGSGPYSCIMTGPFKDYVLHTGPGFANIEHCIWRELDESPSWGASAANVTECMDIDGYADAWKCFSKNPHRAGHYSIGGEMRNTYSSPGDPLFYMHHCWLDKLFADWQALKLPFRLYDIASYTTETEPPTGWVNVTLEDTLHMFGIVPDVQIKDLMDIGGDLQCVEYVDYVDYYSLVGWPPQ